MTILKRRGEGVKVSYSDNTETISFPEDATLMKDGDDLKIPDGGCHILNVWSENGYPLWRGFIPKTRGVIEISSNRRGDVIVRHERNVIPRIDIKTERGGDSPNSVSNAIWFGLSILIIIVIFLLIQRWFSDKN